MLVEQQLVPPQRKHYSAVGASCPLKVNSGSPQGILASEEVAPCTDRQDHTGVRSTTRQVKSVCKKLGLSVWQLCTHHNSRTAAVPRRGPNQQCDRPACQPGFANSLASGGQPASSGHRMSLRWHHHPVCRTAQCCYLLPQPVAFIHASNPATQGYCCCSTPGLTP